MEIGEHLFESFSHLNFQFHPSLIDWLLKNNNLILHLLNLILLVDNTPMYKHANEFTISCIPAGTSAKLVKM